MNRFRILKADIAYARGYDLSLVVGAEVVSNLTMLVNDGAAGTCYLTELFTEEAHRRRGYATALLRRAERLARVHHQRKLSLLCEIGNPHLVNFYERLGFEIDQADPDMVFWKMDKPLAQLRSRLPLLEKVTC